MKLSIASLQDAVDFDTVTDEKKAQLAEWKKYRVWVKGVDTTNPDELEMPI
ncbi:TPA: tail fiber assembly protein [Salmonella enterica subsp. salamae]|nr:tail fiber assembly protein [Salmonella enterica subsp. salamae]HAU3362369.1 tail fiber assembly protein [Salmonella enterica subsp. salamae]